jgi:hypothetical protein
MQRFPKVSCFALLEVEFRVDAGQDLPTFNLHEGSASKQNPVLSKTYLQGQAQQQYSLEAHPSNECTTQMSQAFRFFEARNPQTCHKPGKLRENGAILFEKQKSLVARGGRNMCQDAPVAHRISLTRDACR